MESNRLKRLEGQFQQYLAEVFREMAQAELKGLLLTVTRVNITSDLSLGRVYISIFPAKDPESVIKFLNEKKGAIKSALVQKLEGGLRKMPDLIFYLDDSIDREAEIERLIKGGGESPIK